MLADENIICEAGLAFRTKADDSLCQCNHPKYFNGKKNIGCTRYISIGTDYRASINRDSIFFKKIYSLRTESKRYNSRWKNLNFEKPTVRNITYSLSLLYTKKYLNIILNQMPSGITITSFRYMFIIFTLDRCIISSIAPKFLQ